MPKKIRDWSLRTLQVKLIKIGAKVVRHSRYDISDGRGDGIEIVVLRYS